MDERSGKTAGKKQIKIGSGRRPFYPQQEKQVYERALQERKDGCCVSYASMARDMRDTVNSIHPHSDFKASSGWIKGMKKRYPSTSRVPNLLVPASKWNNLVDAAAITAKNSENIDKYFTFVNTGKQMHSYKPENIINCDETPVYFNNVAKKTVHFDGGNVVAAKVMEGNPQARVSVMLATTSDGKLLDPCMIEASQSKAAKSDGGSTRYVRHGVTMWKQENQTMTSSIMVSWVDWLAAQFNAEERKMLIMDTHRSHMTDAVKTACKQHNIDIVMIPGGCTKYLQPLDLTVNRSFKSKLKQHYYTSMKHYDGVIDKAQKQSANKINMEVLCRDVVAAAKDITRDCILNGWNSTWKRDGARA